MGELINLRLARKSKLRIEKAAQASENRAKFGMPLSERKQQVALAEQDKKALDGHRLVSNETAPE